MNNTVRKPVMRLVAVMLVLGGMFAPFAASAASQPRDNDANSIIWGGCYTHQECLDKFDHGDGHGHSAANLQQIYFNEGRGITRANFMQTVDGTVYKDGRVMVNGQLVATAANAVGREYMPGSTKSGSVWGRPTSVSFVADSIPAFVYMENGTFRYFVIKSCGNAGWATPVPKPSPSPSPSKTPTPTPSPSKTPTPTPSKTPTPTPPVTQTPTPTPTGEVKGTQLPATGPETALGGMVGLGAIAYGTRAYLRSRKGLTDALRNKKNR